MLSLVLALTPVATPVASPLAPVAGPVVPAAPPVPAHGANFPPPPPDPGPSKPPPPEYKGPVAPPRTPGPRTPGPPVPGTPGGGSPPQPTGPKQPAPASGAGLAAGVDLEGWHFWWNYNKHGYLDLKAHIYASSARTGGDDYFLGLGERADRRERWRPTDEDVHGRVVPLLLESLDESRSNDVLTAAMVALGKIGAGPELGASDLVNRLTPFLAHSSQEVAETAAVSLGILGAAPAVPTLVDLLSDSERGRKLVRSTEVSPRTRAFAAYGLGVVGARTSDNALRQRVAEHLIDVLVSPQFATRDVKVAAMTALGLVPLDAVAAIPRADSGRERGPNVVHVLSRRTQISFLLDYFAEANARENKTTRHWFVRAHAPTALARLCDGADEDTIQAVARELLKAVGKHSKARDEISESVALALGSLGDADDGGVDADIRETLERLAADGSPLGRRFALVSLARVGARPGESEEPLAATDAVRKVLLRFLTRGTTRIRPWAGLALGILGHDLARAGTAPDDGASRTLRSVAQACRRPQDIGAYAVAVGLRRDAAASEVLLERLEFFSDAEARGYVIVGLGQLDQRDSIAAIQAVLAKSKYKPQLLWQAAIGLGLLGDKEVVPELVGMLREARGLGSQGALASALGLIGDRRSIEPLVLMAREEDGLTERARAFALVALGLVCDREPLPWNARMSEGVHYLARTPTLAGSATGVLDIL